MPRTLSAQSRHDNLLAEGRAALLAGDKPRAQALLTAAVRLQPQSEEAWLWLSGAHTDPDAMADCLRHVLTINPHNEQAQEGLRWLEAEHGLPPTPVPALPETIPAPTPVVLHPRPEARSVSVLLEAALHPFATGAVLGLLRLVGWLRPTTLALMRGDAGPLSLRRAILVALAAALLHGLALLIVWLGAGWQLSRIRTSGRGDLFDSLLRAGWLWLPGYLWGVALALAALGLGLSPAPWNTIAIVCWALVLGGVVLIERRLYRELDEVGVARIRRAVVAGRLYLTIIVSAVLGLGLAGIVTAALLR